MMQSARSHIRQREKLLADIADAIRFPVDLRDGPRSVRVCPTSYQPILRYADLAAGPHPEVLTSYTVHVHDVVVCGVKCQAFAFEGVLLKVLPI